MVGPDIAFVALEPDSGERFQSLRRQLGVRSFGMNLIVLQPGQRGRIHSHQEFFAVIGDLNDEPLSAPLKPLVSDAGLIDALARFPKVEDRWTHWFKSENTVSQLDHILLSPALNAATTGKQPRIERRGIGFSRILADGGPGPRLTHFHRMDDDPNPINLDFRFPRFTNLTPEHFASDHCPVFLQVP